MADEPTSVLALPPCMVCSDQAASLAVQARGVLALVCDACLPLMAGGILSVADLVDGGGLPSATAGQARSYLASQTWTFAKTMPRWPHEYVLLRKSTDLWMHLRVVAFIRLAGEKRPFGGRGRVHSYWQPGDGTEVWTMRPFDTILNRRGLES